MGSRRRPIRRIITRASVFLLMGAIVNVAVAWGLALWLPLQTDQRPSRTTAVPDAIAHLVPTEWTQIDPRLMHPDDPGIGEATLAMSVYDTSMAGLVAIEFSTSIGRLLIDKLLPDHVLQVRRAGWPLPALQCVAYLSSSTPNAAPVWLNGVSAPRFLHPKELDAFHLPFASRLPRPMPYRPIWPGFAINTLFYAAILWGLFAAPFALRRRRRIKRGLCPKCAYDLRGCASQNCPECGKPVKPEAGVR